MVIPKYVGGDCELAATGTDPDGHPLRAHDVVTDLLAHVDEAWLPHGTRTWRAAAGAGHGGWYHPTDHNRCWTPNGGCVYEDMQKLEVCTPLTLSPAGFAARHIANLHVAEAARRAAEREAAPGTRYRVTGENCDPNDAGISWGSHFNVAIDSDLWVDLNQDRRRPAVYGFVVSALAAATAFFGGGQILSRRNGDVLYSLSSRAHHLGRLTTLPTTTAFERGITNARREGFCETADRQHLINFDYGPIGARLRCSLVQCIYAAAEEGFSDLVLYEPARALRRWSFGLELDTGELLRPAMLSDGRSMTLTEYVRQLATSLLRMFEAKLIDPRVAPEADELLPRVVELCDRLDARDLGGAARHLDWAAKLMVVLGLCAQPGTTLGDASTRLAGYDFLNTDPGASWFFRLWNDGKVDPLVTAAEVERGLVEAPPESRAWALGAIVSRFPDDVRRVDWDTIELQRDGDRWGRRLRIRLPRLDSLNRAILEPILHEARNGAHLGDLLDAREEVDTADPADTVVDDLFIHGHDL